MSGRGGSTGPFHRQGPQGQRVIEALAMCFGQCSHMSLNPVFVKKKITPKQIILGTSECLKLCV